MIMFESLLKMAGLGWNMYVSVILKTIKIGYILWNFNMLTEKYMG